MREKTLKGLIHAALAAASYYEYRGTKTKTRKFLLGLATGWHCHCALYHFLYEKDEKMSQM